MAKVPALVLLLLVLGCNDHLYRHDIAGRVVSAGNRPVVGAVVQRVNDKGDPYGHDDGYRRVTDAEGKFSFVAEGRGPSPMAFAPWTVKVTQEKFAERILEVRAAWSNDKTTCFGYCAKDFTIELQ